ncbi:hypothetical protein CMQ_5712 [Grosmannia clavigera kw1407]|uniref:Uncharacterized protein n=1 Tax=Grosmannia clavigera (strain kw1407 / UAMH 11150) TaxID=655863 RepID=F0XSK7_GROCL|nr:uncharacterized protein CMQ_5712 [Grosmannia clavigera kw1407]EFW99291.1 hypothetical protein CMQ_5712 [Grosmannia clavigera kw1407]
MASQLHSAWWRQSITAEEFCDRSGLDGFEKAYFVHLFKERKRKGHTLAEFIIEFASFNLSKHPGIMTIQDPDNVVHLWLEMIQERKTASADETNSFYRKLLAKYEAKETKGQATAWNESETRRRSAAFDRAEKSTASHGYPSFAVIEELRGQFAQYVDAPSLWMGPYTTIIGPSGIGKTFTIKQFAVRHGFYVAYSNLASAQSKCYPRPVVVGELPLMTNKSDRASLVKTWIKFLDLQLHLVRCSQQNGITAPGLFSLMTSAEPDIVQKRWPLQTSSEATMQENLAACKDVLLKHGQNSLPFTDPKERDDAFTIICLDEARALLHDDSDNMSFRALREAAGKVFEDNQSAPFFIILLDTTSRISHFVPPVEQDPSRKFSEKTVFPPIYRIDTWDILADRSPHDADGSDASVTKLFSYGRPLWAANMEAGDSLGELVRLAANKMAGNTDARLLALLSCRVNFYITSRQLAETLVASWMRYLVSFSDDNTMLTVQPSEPVLAYVSSRELQDPAVRLRCVKAWFSNLQKGACNLGDSGEMIAALVLLFAADYVSRPLESRPHSRSMRDLWTSFLGSSSWLAVERRYSNAPNIVHTLENGMIFYNHFVRTSHIPTMDDLALAYRQGAALFLPTNFPGMDIAIPICMGDDEDLAILLIQVKNRQADSPTDGLRRALTEDLEKARKALVGVAHPECVVLGLAMCLRCDGDPLIDIKVPPAPRKKIPGTEKASSVASASTRAAAGAPSNLIGIVFGLGKDVYPCLGKINAGRPEQTAMARVCSLFQDILERWPDFYPDRDTQSAYARRLLYPFYGGKDGEKQIEAGPAVPEAGGNELDLYDE